jgi:hypothetical protein
MDRCSSFTSHSFGKLRCFSIQKASAEGFGSIGNPKLHPLTDLEVAQFVASGRVRLGVRSPVILKIERIGGDDVVERGKE